MRTTLSELLEREVAAAEDQAQRDDELLASAAAGGPFWRRVVVPAEAMARVQADPELMARLKSDNDRALVQMATYTGAVLAGAQADTPELLSDSGQTEGGTPCACRRESRTR